MTARFTAGWRDARAARRPAPDLRASRASATFPRWRETLAALATMPLVAYTMLFPVMRSLGEIPLAASAVCALLATLAIGRVATPVLQLALSLQAACWLVLSLAHVLPSAWTTYFDPVVAIRQWSWVVFVPLVTTAYYALFRRFGQAVWNHALVLAIGWYALSRFGLLIARPDSWQWDVPFIYGVNNLNMPLLALFCVFVFTRQRNVLVDVAMLAACGLLCSSVTNLLVMVAAIGIRVLPMFRLIPILVGGLLVIGLLVAPHFASDLYRLDANTGVRAVMWGDAADAIIQSNGIGVGFGTEYIRNEFGAVIHDWILVDERSPDRTFISTHSAVYDVAMRLGLIGTILFIGWMWALAGAAWPLDDRRARLVSALVVLIFCSLAVNPALVSVNIFMGIAFVAGLIAFVRSEHASQLAVPAMRMSVPRRRTPGPKAA